MSIIKIDMADIKEAYLSQSGHDLREDIQKKHKGNRRKILLGLLKGMPNNAHITGLFSLSH